MNTKQIERYAINKFNQELLNACQNYLLHGLRNGNAKVEYHFAIANIFYEFKTGKIQKYIVTSGGEYRDFKELKIIHDKTSKITNHLDKYLGLYYPYTDIDFDKHPKKLARLLKNLMKEI